MGVDYSYNVGFGVIIPEEDLKAWAKGLGDEYPTEYLEDVEYPEGIYYTEVGNLMSGESSVLVTIARLTKNFDMYDMDGKVHFFNNISVEDDEYVVLSEFVKETWGVTDAPGFFAAGTIS